MWQHFKIKQLIFSVVLVAGGLQSMPAAAVSVSLSLCSLNVTGVAFGTYNFSSGATDDSTGTINFTCTAAGAGTVSYTIGISTGNGTFANRQMISGVNGLYYNLYQDNARSIIWGDGTSGTSIYSDSFSVAIAGIFNKSYTVYGRMPASQLKPAGTYSDTVTVTVTF